jgi:hypothetical protein
VNAVDRKFDDQDVREQPHLVGAAYAFLREYEGEFRFLCDAKAGLLENGYLATPVVRGVLNCMRAQALATPPPRDPAAPERPKPVLFAVQIQRPAWVRLRTRWKRRFVMLTGRGAWLVHILDDRATELRWYPHTGEYQWFPIAVCGQILNTRSAKMVHGVPTGRLICRRCASMERR